MNKNLEFKSELAAPTEGLQSTGKCSQLLAPAQENLCGDSPAALLLQVSPRIDGKRNLPFVWQSSQIFKKTILGLSFGPVDYQILLHTKKLENLGSASESGLT